MGKFRFLLALAAGKGMAWAINLIDPSRGSNFPGELALKLDPDFIRHIRGPQREKTIFVTGTNGKSTTTNLIATLFRAAGRSAAVNLEGANLKAGVAATLLKNATLGGKLKTEYIIMETDERYLPIIQQELPCGQLLVTNIQKDQVQRNGEPDLIRRKISSVIGPETRLYVNNEEPNCAALAEKAGKLLRYGVEKHEKSFSKPGFYTVTMPCPHCGAAIHFEHYNIDNVGPFRCSGCGFSSVQQPEYSLQKINYWEHSASLQSPQGEIDLPFKYDAAYFLYCYAAALAVALENDLPVEKVIQGCGEFVNIGGRMEDIRAGEKTIHYLRMKQENPETLQSALDYIAADPRPKIFMLGLDELTDFHPHYTNTFYAFDCDLEKLVQSNVERFICFSGTVSYDAALRLVYAGADPERISVLPTNDDKTILDELARWDADTVYLITWLHKFYDLSKYARSHQGQTAGGEK
ncbi:MAG: MurT ligase domain-containing protein [Bacillota bacterium]|nr:MurT ligase domain-containing protein [Bacillota bacterium]